jgi:ABC-2 type transport system permease protein
MTGLVGTGALARLILRRDRWVLVGWIAVIVLVGVGTVSYYLSLFATPEARAAFAADLAATPALLAFNGPLFGDSLDVMATWRMRDLSYTLISVMTLMTVIRHTRREEESGRQELVGAAVIGRHASLTAATIVSAVAGVVAALLVAAGMIGLGLAPAGALAYAAAASATGFVFAGVGAVTAQISASGRGALGLGAIVLGLSYIARFAADGSGSTALVWVTPLGWAHQVRPFAGERWVVLLLPLIVAAALIALSQALLARRDFAAGLLPERAGRDRGRLGSAAALAWRQQRGMLAAWTAAYAVAGIFFGGLVAAVGNAPEAIGNSAVVQGFLDRYAAAGGAAGPDVFLWVIALTLGYTAALYPALVITRVRTEEAVGRAELLLSTPATRTAWAGSHAAIAAIGTVALLAAGGLVAGLMLSAGSPDPTTLFRALAAMLIQVPAAWVLGGLTLLILGILPRATAAVGWVGFLFIQLFELVGPIAGIDFRLVEWIIPYFHLPRILTGDPFSPAPILTLAAVTLVLGAGGLYALRRRDLVPTT